MEEPSVIARRLREARLRAGLSQERLGVLAGIDEFSASARMNQYERGKHVPDLLTVERIAVVLGVPAPYFYARDENVAELLLLFGGLTATRREEAILFLKGMVKKTE